MLLGFKLLGSRPTPRGSFSFLVLTFARPSRTCTHPHARVITFSSLLLFCLMSCAHQFCIAAYPPTGHRTDRSALYSLSPHDDGATATSLWGRRRERTPEGRCGQLSFLALWGRGDSVLWVAPPRHTGTPPQGTCLRDCVRPLPETPHGSALARQPPAFRRTSRSFLILFLCARRVFAISHLPGLTTPPTGHS